MLIVHFVNYFLAQLAVPLTDTVLKDEQTTIVSESLPPPSGNLTSLPHPPAPPTQPTPIEESQLKIEPCVTNGPSSKDYTIEMNELAVPVDCSPTQLHTSNEPDHTQRIHDGEQAPPPTDTPMSSQAAHVSRVVRDLANRIFEGAGSVQWFHKLLLLDHIEHVQQRMLKCLDEIDEQTKGRKNIAALIYTLPFVSL